MSIRVERQHGRYVAVPKAVIDDPRLSFRAKGLLITLLAQVDDHTSNTDRFADVAREGTDGMKSVLKELEGAGYYRRLEERDVDGTSRVTEVFFELSCKPLLEAHDEDLPRDGEPTERGAPQTSSDGETQPPPPAERIIDQLNELRERSWEWMRYTPLSARYAKNLEHISGRLSDGYSEQDLILVLEYIAAVDGGKEESRKYFDCVTPFNTKNFERNLAMAREWEARGRPSVRGSGSLQAAHGHDPEIYEKRVRGGTT